MKSLNIKSGGWPLKSSLFWYDKSARRYESTWPLLCRNWDAAKRQRLIDKQTEYGCNFLTFYLYHFDDPNCIVNPFVGCPNPKKIATGNVIWDWVELTKWVPYLELGKHSDIWIVPTFFCGDSKEATNNTAFHDMFVPQLAQVLHPFVDGFNIASEASKKMNTVQMERMIRVIRNAWKVAGLKEKYIFVHWQWNQKDRLPNNADALMYEFSFHPKDGTRKSVAEVVKEAKNVLAK